MLEPSKSTPAQVAQSIQQLLNQDELSQAGRMQVHETLRRHFAAHTEQRHEVVHLDPETIHGPYKDNGGAYCTGHHHLAKIFPGYEKPADADIERLQERGNETYGTMPAMETAIIRSIVKSLRPRTFFEIGTHQGNLSREIMGAASEIGNDSLIGLTLDLPPSRHGEFSRALNSVNQDYVKDRSNKDATGNMSDEMLGAAFKDPSFEPGKRMVQLLGDSQTFNFKPFAGMMDVVVVDGNHEYHAAARDLLTALELVSPGGVIFVDDFMKGFRNQDVATAVNAVTMERGKTFYWANWGAGSDAEKIPGCHLAFHLNIREAQQEERSLNDPFVEHHRIYNGE